MTDSRTFTHVGWFWFCPIYFAQHGDDADVAARYWWLEWLFAVCMLFEDARIWMSMAMWPDYEPEFAFNVKPLAEPVTLDR